MKTILTGASGFLGKSVYHELIKFGHDVTCLVRKPSGFKNEVIADLDDLSEEKIAILIQDAACIIHLAALADFRKDFSAAIYQTNCMATIKLIWAAKQSNIHFVFASNALISGTEVSNINQDTPDNPNIPYNISKYICECLIVAQLKSYSILRIGGIFGLFGPEHLYLNRAINNALTKKIPPNLNGSGDVVRNYIYVKDLSAIIRVFAEQKIIGKKLIGGADVKNIKNILELVAEICIGPNVELTMNDAADNSFDQIIKSDVMPIKLHTYEEAFYDIKNDYRNHINEEFI